MSNIEILTWIMTSVSLIGTWLNSKANKNGFWFWLVANLFWVIYDFHLGNYAQSALFLVNSSMCIQGLIVWKKLDKEGDKK